MIGPALLSALKAAGGSELVKYALSAAGATLIQHIEERIGIQVGESGFDQPAADYALANMQEMNDFRLAMREADSKDLKTEVEDRQHAREQPLTKTLVAIALVLVVAAVVSVVGTLAILLFTPIFKPGVVYPDASMILITAIVNFMLGSVLGVAVQYLWGTNRTSEDQNNTIREAVQQIRKAPASQPSLNNERPVIEPEPQQVYIDEVNRVEVPPELTDMRPYR